MIKGEKVLLREIRKSDIDYAVRWVNDPEVTQYLMIYPPISGIAEERWLQNIGENKDGKFAFFVIEAIEGETTKPIGNVELSHINHHSGNAEFGIAIFEKDYWSDGYGTEAAEMIIRYGFEQLNLHRISSFAHAFNERSLRMHRKVGFKEEGRRRKAYYRNGAYHDEVVFGLLKGDWVAGKQA